MKFSRNEMALRAVSTAALRKCRWARLIGAV
jgi:hypothetical protein